MPGSLFTIRLDSLREKLNLTNIKSPQDLSNEIPNDPISFPTSENVVTFQSPNLEQKLPVTTESVVTTEPACSLDCGAAGNCYIEQFRSDEENGDVTRIDDTRPRRSSYKQRCQCPLGRTGDRCQN
ncbi:Protein of unknown function, partial [Cotesia congregata]